MLLVASSFMSPAESKSFTNINRVRMFGKQGHFFIFFELKLWISEIISSTKNHILAFAGVDKLSKPVAAQKWDRIKLVCTQPFNKVNNFDSFLGLCIFHF